MKRFMCAAGATAMSFLICCRLAAAAEFKLELSGMIGFAIAPDGGVYVLLVNELDRVVDPMHRVIHSPELELQCADFRIPTDEQACLFWPSTLDLKRRRIALDRNYMSGANGLELQLDIGGADAKGAVKLLGDFGKLVVPLDDLDQGVADRSLLRKEALAPATASQHGIVRVKLNGGTLTADAAPDSGMSFKTYAGSELLHRPATTGTAMWSISYDPTKASRVDLVSLQDGQVERSLDLQAETGMDLNIVLANDPDAFQYCAHIPQNKTTALTHYIGFLDLTPYARSKTADDLKKLPLPYLDEPTMQCDSSHTVRGRRVNCMMVLFSGIEP